MLRYRKCCWNRQLDIMKELRTEGRRSRVRELGSIQRFNVTSANVVRFLPNFLHLVIQAYGTTVENLIMILFIFTILLNMTRSCPVLLHVLRGIITSAWKTCKITGQQIVNINHIVTKSATFVPYTCMIICTKCGKKWTTFAEVTLKSWMDPSSRTRDRLPSVLNLRCLWYKVKDLFSLLI